MHFDILLIVGFFGSLLLFVARLFQPDDDRLRLKRVMWVGVLTCVVLECLQPLAGRSAGLGDLLFGLLGVGLAGWVLARMVIGRQQC